MSHKWIKEGDTVKVISGNDKGQIGKVLARAGTRIIVQGVNIRKKHLKQQKDQSGGPVSIERPIHISNVALSDDQGKAICLKLEKDGRKKELFYDKDGSKTLFRSLEVIWTFTRWKT